MYFYYMNIQSIQSHKSHDTLPIWTDTSKLALSVVLIGSALCLATLPVFHRFPHHSKHLHLFSVITGTATAGIGVCALMTQVFTSATSKTTNPPPPLELPPVVVATAPQEVLDEEAQQFGYEQGYRREKQRILEGILRHKLWKMSEEEHIDLHRQNQHLLDVPRLSPFPSPGRSAERAFWKSYYQGYTQGHLIALKEYLETSFATGILSNVELSCIVQDLSQGQICLLRNQVGALQAEPNFCRFSSPYWVEDPLLLHFTWKLHIDTSTWRLPY